MSTVLIIGDTHAPCMKEGYVEFLLEKADYWQADRIIHIGDLVDRHSSNYHEKEPENVDAEREFEKALTQVQQITEAFPKADLLLGNHDVLEQRKAKTAGILQRALKSFGDLWELPKGWNVHPRYTD